MKKSMILALVAGTFLFSACGSDDALEGGVAQNDAAQQIVLQVASSGDGLQTRAGRPLYSSASLQSIENVRVLVYKADSKKIVYDSKKSLDWKKSLEYTTGGHGRRLTITLKGEDKIQTAGDYKIVAVGYSDNTDYNFAQDVKGDETLKGQTYTDITATLNATTNDAEEVFAGDADLKIDDKLNVSNKAAGELGAAVTMHRQVAGGFGYFQNIPARVDDVKARYLRLVMRSKNNVLTFNNFNSNFTTTTNNLKYVVNGSRSADAPTADAHFSEGTNVYTNGDEAYTLYSIDLDQWFPDGDKNGDGFLNANDTWTHLASVKAALVKGSVFAGKFIVPFEMKAGNKTMELQLLAKDGHIIKVWNVTIPDANINPDLGLTDESASVFNVVRNHMYNLGVKVNQDTKPEPGNPDPTPGPDPVDPTPDVDQPEDLSKGQNLVLKVNDNWETIHQMGLE